MRRVTSLVLLMGALLGRAAWAVPAAAPVPVVLDGDPELAATLGEALGGRGIAASSSADGDALRVKVTRSEDGIALVLLDPEGRGTERTVTSQETAVAVIESWSRGEIAEPLLVPHRPVAVQPPPAVEPPAVRQAPPPPAPAVVREAPPRASFRFVGETAAGSDGSHWLGVSVGVCTRIGRLCLGAEARAARARIDAPPNVREHLDVVSLHQTFASDWEGLFTAELPIALAHGSLILGLAAGPGVRIDGDQRRAGLRGEARAVLALPVWSTLAIDVGLTAAPLPGGSAHTAEGFETRSGSQLRFGLGVRWGQP